ncbi:MAG: hypothetical protein KBC84_06615 [Proteobacteria bacterium]|nr:hypothetical protein [Pseudomonadota bacterium]
MDYSVEHQHRKAKEIFTDSIKSGSTRFKARIATALSSANIGRKVANIVVSPFSAIHGAFDSFLPVLPVSSALNTTAQIDHIVVIPPVQYPVAAAAAAICQPQVSTTPAVVHTCLLYRDSVKESEKNKVDIDNLLEEWVIVDRQTATLAAK